MVPSAPRTDKKICAAVGVVWASEKFADSGPSWPKTSASMLSRIAYTDAQVNKADLDVEHSKTYIDLAINENHIPNGKPG